MAIWERKETQRLFEEKVTVIGSIRSEHLSLLMILFRGLQNCRGLSNTFLSLHGKTQLALSPFIGSFSVVPWSLTYIILNYLRHLRCLFYLHVEFCSLCNCADGGSQPPVYCLDSFITS